MTEIAFEAIGEKELCFYSIVGLRQIWKRRNEFSYWNHPRPDNGLTLILCENAVYTLKNGGCLRAKSGDLVLIPQGSCYTVRFTPTPAGDHDTLLLNFRLCDPTGFPVKLSGEPRVLCRDKEAVLFGQMNTGINAARKGKNLRARRFLLSALEFALEQLSESHEEPIAPVLGYIAEHLGDPLSVPELARRFAMSESTLRRLFVKCTGVSPVAYIRRQKIKLAQRMLTSGECSVEVISAQLGFYDVSYFYKSFRAVTGKTPAEYRGNVPKISG